METGRRLPLAAAEALRDDHAWLRYTTAGTMSGEALHTVASARG